MDREATEVCLLGWLECFGGLASLRGQCYQHKTAEKPQAVYKLSLTVDPLELLQYNAYLGDLLLHCPRQFWRLVQRLSYVVAHSLDWLPALSSPSQLLLELRLSSLPALPGYTIAQPSDLPPLSAEPRFLSTSGVVVAATPLSQYTQYACFYCCADGCEGGRDESRYIRLHVAGTNEASTVRNDATCQTCGSALVEDMAFRTLANKMLVHLVPSHSLQNSPVPLPLSSTAAPSPSHHRHQAMPIILRDGLCEGVRVGGEYSVIGVPVYMLNETSQRAHVTARLEVCLTNSLHQIANNVFCVEREAVSVGEVEAGLPDAVTDMYRACGYSPWAFSATLAYSLAADLAPPGAYHQLKMAMLLSLVSCTGRNARCPLHLLVVATDTTPLPALLLYGSSLSPRSTQLTPTSDLWGSTRKEEGDLFVEGGGLVLASGGVCVAGSLQQLKKEKVERLQNTLETSQIKLPLPSAREEVWAFSVPGGPGSRNIHESSAVTKALADVMGLLVICDCPTTDGADFLSGLMTQHILDRATGTASAPPLSHSHLHQFLSAISGLEVSLSPACQHLLRSFYLASRRVRASSLYGTDMPVNALDVMSGLAEAHARLNLRSEAEEEDGVMAILLYEESLAGRYGHSVLNLLPAPHFRDSDLSAYLGSQFDRHMKTLHSHILHFCKCHVSGSSALMPEE